MVFDRGIPTAHSHRGILCREHGRRALALDPERNNAYRTPENASLLQSGCPSVPPTPEDCFDASTLWSPPELPEFPRKQNLRRVIFLTTPADNREQNVGRCPGRPPREPR